LANQATDDALVMPVTIRRASVGDAGAIAEIGARGWRAAYRGILPEAFLAGLTVSSREIAWRTMLEQERRDDAPAWIAERGGRPIGFVHNGPPRDEDVPAAAVEIYAIYVLPEAWRGGAGRALMDAATGHWRGRRAQDFVLWVLEANTRGRSFYQAVGWRPDGVRQEIDFGGFSAVEVRYTWRSPA
jgi:GNAT superfamily N-acetyltransferase